MASEGLTDKEIAGRLGISTATVKSYWLRIRSKTGGFNRTQAVANRIRREQAAPAGSRFEALCACLGGVVLVLDANAELLRVHGPGAEEWGAFVGRGPEEWVAPGHAPCFRAELRDARVSAKGMGVFPTRNGVLSPMWVGALLEGGERRVMVALPRHRAFADASEAKATDRSPDALKGERANSQEALLASARKLL